MEKFDSVVRPVICPHCNFSHKEDYDLQTCANCNGDLSRVEIRCPRCDEPLKRWLSEVNFQINRFSEVIPCTMCISEETIRACESELKRMPDLKYDERFMFGYNSLLRCRIH